MGHEINERKRIEQIGHEWDTNDTNQTKETRNERMKTNGTNRTKMILHKELSYQIIGAVYNTRKIYGPGQKEIVYQRGLAEELKENNIPYKREVNINIISPKSGRILSNYRVDFVIKEKVILELKSLKFLPQKMEQQLYSYLRSTPYEVGYLINMGGPEIDIKRVILTNDRKPYLHLFCVR